MAASLNEKAAERYAKAAEFARNDPLVQGLRRLPGYSKLVQSNADHTSEPTAPGQGSQQKRLPEKW